MIYVGAVLMRRKMNRYNICYATVPPYKDVDYNRLDVAVFHDFGIVYFKILVLSLIIFC